MPAAYAHISLVNRCKEPANLDSLSAFPPAARSAINRQFRFCELGAVSPDYPYLTMGSKGAKKWADLMHYENTTDVIRCGANLLGSMTGAAKEKGTAWLLGYAAHVVTDVSIHPIVELKVGPYDKNKRAHRVCEMHQDVHIYQPQNMGAIGVSEHLKQGIGRCGESPSGKKLDSDIRTLWSNMLELTHPAEFKKNPPKVDKWHSGFLRGVEQIAEEGGKLIPLARHVALGLAIIYPDSVNNAYIKNLATPFGLMDYDAIFKRAIVNVSIAWNNIAQSIFNNCPKRLSSMPNWDMDTGRDESEHLTYWS